MLQATLALLSDGFRTGWLSASEGTRAVRQAKYRFRHLDYFWSVLWVHLHCVAVKRAKLFLTIEMAVSDVRSGTVFFCARPRAPAVLA